MWIFSKCGYFVGAFLYLLKPSCKLGIGKRIYDFLLNQFSQRPKNLGLEERGADVTLHTTNEK